MHFWNFTAITLYHNKILKYYYLKRKCLGNMGSLLATYNVFSCFKGYTDCHNKALYPNQAFYSIKIHRSVKCCFSEKIVSAILSLLRVCFSGLMNSDSDSH